MCVLLVEVVALGGSELLVLVVGLGLVILVLLVMLVIIMIVLINAIFVCCCTPVRYYSQKIKPMTVKWRKGDHTPFLF
jgi:hypothetical protein